MLTVLNALNDNYIWLYSDNRKDLLVVDPTVAAPVLTFLQQHSEYQLTAILLTHNHYDHIDGVAELRLHYPQVPVYGPQEIENVQQGLLTQIIEVGRLNIGHYNIEILSTGGHTAGHLSYLINSHLFCGDTLFSAGCGRVFTQDYAQMFNSLQTLKKLPTTTIICPAHEYTLSNLAFARTVDLEDEGFQTAVKQHQQWAIQKRQAGEATLPVTLAGELQINPFLRAKNLAEFIQLRQAKDQFK
ncbi:hydroxyacylglutathione hydrolase [Mergibacter septicus]|uniref:Hydroxyacylglutathione hydrolase n=1 Tax=Mergibacter septicus TaxID=221402 RepID=A0A8E3MFQ7_9PAST|nr:hydroxyacylglutathione hydrolase [Mergibacter septicus]AWX15073.1 hydroxyacylglutathione hydrolase [Mergibacter septicus]QDJ14326.1 hydroxyacylglutathione hydrolase [Mergibacter septicus]UTU48233.1 hydroxyacylglutathione hydrolase [Mergibacter septicus]WMR96149.1 hydroxyacylglutathione hydrolase [Mergibacter septicus]